MPITLPPISRRGFLGGSLAAGVGMLAGCSHLGRRGKEAEANRFALLSDIHVAGDKGYVHKTGVVPWANLQKAAGEVCGLSSRPAVVIVNGDCACMEGKPEDYARVVEGVKGLREAGMPVHMALGNHDHRENFWKALPADAARQAGAGVKHALVVGSPLANWFVLDSLMETNKTPGTVGGEQLAWLAEALDARAEKPAMVMVHHDPKIGGKGGLEDTGPLMEVILARKQVKACIYGHTHVWGHAEKEGMHLVNLPTTAWVFDGKSPRGWVDVMLEAKGATFELRALDRKHAEHGRKLALAWR